MEYPLCSCMKSIGKHCNLMSVYGKSAERSTIKGGWKEMLTEKELDYISRGLVALIRDASDAKKLVLDRKAQREIDRYTKELQALNTKICMMEGAEE